WPDASEEGRTAGEVVGGVGLEECRPESAMLARRPRLAPLRLPTGQPLQFAPMLEFVILRSEQQELEREFSRIAGSPPQTLCGGVELGRSRCACCLVRIRCIPDGA